MVSAIDETKPEDGVLALKSDFRDNFGAAKTEIEALQAEVVALLGALQLASGALSFAPIDGDNFPTEAANLIVILQTLDLAITAAAQNGGGNGGATSLADITDLLQPSSAQRAAWQAPVDGGPFDADFSFNEGEHAGRFLTLDTPDDPVTMTLPEASGLNRPDGWLCRVTVNSAVNFGAITAPTDTIRFQQGRFGVSAVTTTMFIGMSRPTSIRSLVDVYKDGAIYQIVGAGRTTETDDLSVGAAGSLNASVLVAESLLAAAFPTALDLGGTKQAGGGRDLLVEIAGNHTFLQSNAGKILEHTGGAAATWNVPALLPGTTVEIDNAIGGAITFNDTGTQTFIGGNTLSSGSAGAIRWLDGSRVRLIGTL